MAEDVGQYCASKGWRLVYGGASIGLMGAMADAALSQGGEVIGVIPAHIQEHEVAHNGLTELYVTDTLHQRQQKMFDLADGFLVLPGGLGTLAEFFEVVTWKQLGRHTKPIYVMDKDNYWNSLRVLVENAEDQGFIHKGSRHLFTFIDDLSDFKGHIENGIE